MKGDVLVEFMSHVYINLLTKAKQHYASRPPAEVQQ